MMNPYSKASKAYQKNNDETLTPLQIVVELYKGMIRNVREAKTCWQQGRLDVMTDHIIKTFNIIEALQANLDIVNGGEDAQFLNRFYNVIFSSLTMATAKVEPEKEFDDIIAYIQQVHDRWYSMAYPNRISIEGDVPAAQMVAQQAQASATLAE